VSESRGDDESVGRIVVKSGEVDRAQRDVAVER
jgi:hypothetical protein